MEKILNEKQRSEMEQYLEAQGVKEAYAIVTTYETIGEDAQTTIQMIKEDNPEE